MKMHGPKNKIKKALQYSERWRRHKTVMRCSPKRKYSVETSVEKLQNAVLDEY